MRVFQGITRLIVGLILFSRFAEASDIIIHVPGTDAITRVSASFSCDANATKLGLPAGTFVVEYINGAGNSLAVIPVAGHRLIFANILSASGARYAAQTYTWSDGGARGAFLWSDSLAGHMQTLCKQEK